MQRILYLNQEKSFTVLTLWDLNIMAKMLLGTFEMHAFIKTFKLQIKFHAYDKPIPDLMLPL